MTVLSNMFFGALLSGCNSDASKSSSHSHTTGAWSHGNQLVFDGRTRTYSFYAPTSGDIRGLGVVLHGGGDSVEHLVSASAFETTAEDSGLLVAVPAGVDNGWNDEDAPGNGHADDVGFIDALVTEIKTLYPNLPTAKIVAHGFSNGGGLATRLACESSHIRGVGVIGNYYMPITDSCPRPVGYPVPGWFGAGLDDELVPVETVRNTMSAYVADLNDCQSTGSLTSVDVSNLPSDVVCKQLSDCDSARLCEYEDRGHEIIPGSFSAAWRFLNESIDASSN